MHYLITAIGSYGDVHPMVGLGMALVAQGHRVSLVANENFRVPVENAGLEFLALGTREEYLELVGHPDLWHPVRGQLLAFRYGCAMLLRPLYELLIAHYVPGETVFCAHGLDAASRVAADKLAAPIASVNFAPSIFISSHQSARLPLALWGDRVPRWMKRFQYWLGDKLVFGPLLGPEVNRLRRELDLPPVRRFLTRWWHDTDLVLGLFPDWFAAPQPDWPRPTVLTGFPLWDDAELNELAPELDDFLRSGDPPIVFTPGSANAHAAGFFRVAAAACRRLGRRGIFLTKFAEQLPPDLPPTIRHFGFVPLSQVLPRSAAFVHHGGIGSCAQGLAAGVPQLVRPLGFDQFDNSLHLQRLGVSDEVSVSKFREPAVATALDRLLASPDVRVECQRVGSWCDGPQALANARDALETLAHPALAR